MTNDERKKPGVYYHDKKGFAVYETDGQRWTIDKGLMKRHPFLRLKVHIVEQGTGWYFQEKSLKDYHYWGEL